MIIKTLTATFGKLDRARLELTDGLNVIYAPNEAGKSTWCAFLRAMFYGIPTRDRDKKGHLAEKNRWQPWSGAPMEGEAELVWQGRSITLRRFAKGGVPFGGFSAVYTDSQLPVPDLTAHNCGELLLGVGREVWERSAFLGHAPTLAIDGTPELERRIAALFSSGQEDVSFSLTEARLREWQRRRQYNRTGLIPRLEEERRELETTLARMESAEARMTQAAGRRRELEARQLELEEEEHIHRRLAQRDLNRRYAAACEERRQLAAQLEQLELASSQDSVTPFAGLDGGQALGLAHKDSSSAHTLLAGAHRARSLRPACLLPGLVPGGALAVLSLFQEDYALFFLLGGAGAFLLSTLLLVWSVNRTITKHLALAQRILTLYGVEQPEQIVALAQAHSRREGELRECRARLELTRRRCDELLGQGAQEVDTLELLHTPERTPEQTNQALAQVRAALAAAGQQLAQARGERLTLGDRGGLELRLAAVSQELVRRRVEYNALTLALDSLRQANSDLQARLAPELNRQAGQILCRLTGGRYRALSLDREFEASARSQDSLLPRSTLSLSRGTADQIYLAVRLAVCQLCLPQGSPLVLDDALLTFDDTRLALALDYLSETGGQVLLFSCQKREADLGKGTILCLQS